MNQNLRQSYREKVIPTLMEQFKYKNIHEVPKITKITINRGLGDASKNNKALESSIREIATVTGQQPVVTKARKSVAGFSCNTKKENDVLFLRKIRQSFAP
jgi:large subunit ribosomal protein L5